MTIPNTRQATAQGTQTREASFRSIITALESQIVLAMQYDQTKTTVVEDTFQLLSTPALTGAKYGYNSQMYLAHLKAYLASGGQVVCWGVPIAEPAAATAAAGTITLTAVPSESGTLVFYVCGNRFTVPVTTTDTATTLGDKVAAAINAAVYVGFTAANVTGTVTLTCTWAGTSGNQGRFFVGPWKTDDPEIPAGVSAVVVQPTNGGGEEDTVLANMWAAVLASSEWRTDVITPSNTSTALDDALAAIGLPDDGTGQGSGLWADMVYRPCTNWSGSIETNLTTIKAVGDARKNDPDNIIVCSPDAMEFPFEIAVATAAYVGRSANSNPARSYKGASMSNWLMGALDEANDWTRDPANLNVDTALKAGLTTIKTDDNGNTTLGDVATTWHPDGATFPPFQFEVNKRKTWNVALTVKNDKLQFQNDVIVESTEEASDQPLAVDEDMYRGRIVGLAEGWQRLGWVYNRAFTINNMVVERSSTNPDRFNRAIPILLSGNKRVESDTILVDRNLDIANDLVTVVIG